MNLKGKIESSLIYNTLPDLIVNTDHHSFGNICHKAYAPKSSTNWFAIRNKHSQQFCADVDS